MNTAPVTRIKLKQPVPYELTAIHQDTHDTKTFCFAPPDNATLDMRPGDHLYVHATINGKPVERPYTPSSMPGATGSFDLTICFAKSGMHGHAPMRTSIAIMWSARRRCARMFRHPVPIRSSFSVAPRLWSTRSKRR